MCGNIFQLSAVDADNSCVYDRLQMKTKFFILDLPVHLGLSRPLMCR
jgi:hypothetical protein